MPTRNTTAPAVSNEDELLEPQEAAPVIHMSQTWLMEHKTKLRIPFVKFGRKVFFKRASLLAWLDTHEQNAV